MLIKMQFILKSTFLQKSFDNLNFNKSFNDIYDFFFQRKIVLFQLHIIKIIFLVIKCSIIDKLLLLKCIKSWTAFAKMEIARMMIGWIIFYRHVLTSDWSTINNKNVKFLRNFGTKFWMNGKVSYKKALAVFNNNNDNFI